MTRNFDTLLAEAKEAIPAVSVDEASRLHGNGTAVFVDPRPADAIASTTGIIPGALNVTLDQIENGALPQAIENPAASVITSCQAGPMAAVAAHALARRGFTDVRYLAGGTQAWLDHGHATNR